MPRAQRFVRLIGYENYLKVYLVLNSNIAKNLCWEWTGPSSNGYGRAYKKNKHIYAHRLSYEVFVGPVPKGLCLDHLCRNRGCINPKHLEPVTLKENCHRGVSPPAVNRLKKKCKNGHAFTVENTKARTRSSGGRSCILCSKLSFNRWRLKKGFRSGYYNV